jgi:hypothetical protein
MVWMQCLGRPWSYVLVSRKMAAGGQGWGFLVSGCCAARCCLGACVWVLRCPVLPGSLCLGAALPGAAWEHPRSLCSEVVQR